MRTSLGVYPTQGLRVSWGGINGGVLVAVGLMLLLAALGLAIGISAVEPRTTDAGSIGSSAAIWSGVSLLVALFVGGFAATRLGATTDSTTGFFEGALVWVVSVVLMTYLAATGLDMATSGAFSILGGSTDTVQGAEQVQPEAATAAWITFGALALSLLTAIFGSMTGRRSLVSDDSRTHADAG